MKPTKEDVYLSSLKPFDTNVNYETIKKFGKLYKRKFYHKLSTTQHKIKKRSSIIYYATID